MENKTNNKTNKDHPVALQSQLGVKDDMRHWDIYSSDSNVLSEEEQLQKIMDSEIIRLKKLYQLSYDKYDKRIDKLIAKRDYELGVIWDSLIKEQAKRKARLGISSNG